MRSILKYWYLGTACVAGSAMISIVAIIVYQVIAREMGLSVRGSDDLIAWLAASASLAGAGYCFSQDGHVRVSLLIERLSGKAKTIQEIMALSIALVIAGYAAYACCLMVYESYLFNDLSQGELVVPLWIPQTGVAIGTVSLAIALADALAQALGYKQQPSASHLITPEI